MSDEPEGVDGQAAPPEDAGRRGSLLDLARAVALGVRDTAAEMAHEARRGAQLTRLELWQRYDEKTHRRREQPPED